MTSRKAINELYRRRREIPDEHCKRCDEASNMFPGAMEICLRPTCTKQEEYGRNQNDGVDKLSSDLRVSSRKCGDDIPGTLHYPILDYIRRSSTTFSKGNVLETDVVCEKKSDIWLKTKAGKLVNAGFKIIRCKSDLMIIELDPANDIASQLQLKENDRILTINNVAVNYYEHHEVILILQKIFSQEQSHLHIVIERTELTNTGEVAVLIMEEDVDCLESRGGVGSAVTLITRVKTLFCGKPSSFSPVYCMEYKGASECLIAIRTRISQLYLQCDTEGKLTMSNLPSRTDRSFHFKMILFHGFQRMNSKNHACFPCLLQLVKTEKYVSVKPSPSKSDGEKDVKLLTTDQGLEGIQAMTSIQEPDSRLFFLKNAEERGEYVFESVDLHDMFLTWNITEKKMELANSTKSPSSHSVSTFCIYFTTGTV